MKIIILTEGGSKVGLGHMSRCIALCQAFRRYGQRPLLLINGDKSIADFVLGVEFKRFNWLKKKNDTFKMLCGSDIVIIDSYLADLDFYKKVSSLTKSAVYIDDFNRLKYPKGIILNGTVYGKDMPYTKEKDRISLVGPEYVLLRKEFWQKTAKKYNKNIKSILLTIGGGHLSKNIIHFIKFLQEEYPHHLKNIITGNKLIKIKDKNTNMMYFATSSKLRKILLDSDIAISAGGHTLYELLRIGLPTIGICFYKNQLLNLTALNKLRVIDYLGWYNNRNLFRKLKKSINRMS